MTIRHDEGTIAGPDGVDLFHQSWSPAGPVRGTVIVVHGLGEHGGRYVPLVDRLVPLGYALHAADHRGHGRSGGERGRIERFDDLVEDLERFRTHVRRHREAGPLVILGHSMGGAVALSHAARHPDALDALALSAPASAGDARTSWRHVTALRVRARLRPDSTAAAIPATAVSSVPEEVAAYERDPLVHHGPIPIRTRAEVRARARRLPGLVHTIRVPVLILHGDADLLVPVEATRVLAGRLRAPSLTVRIYPGLRHEVFHEAGRDQVLDDLVEWLDAVTRNARTRDPSVEPDA